MGQAGHPPLQPEVEDEGARRERLLGPVAGRVGPRLLGQQLGLGVGHVGVGDHQVGAELLPRRQPDARRPSALGEDLRHGRFGPVPDAVLRTDRRQRADDRVDAALGIEHAHVEVDVAHDVVERWGVVGRRAQEDQLVLEDLLHRVAGEAAADVGVHVLEDVQRPALHRGLAIDEVEEAVVVAVHELLDRDPVLLLGAVQVVPQGLATTGLQPFERVDVPAQVGVHVDVQVRAPEGDPVRRVEPLQVQVVLDALAEQGEEVLEDVGHQVPGRTHVEAEAVGLEVVGAAAEQLVLLQHRHLVTVLAQQGGAAQPPDATADDQCRAHRARR